MWWNVCCICNVWRSVFLFTRQDCTKQTDELVGLALDPSRRFRVVRQGPRGLKAVFYSVRIRRVQGMRWVQGFEGWSVYLLLSSVVRYLHCCDGWSVFVFPISHQWLARTCTKIWTTRNVNDNEQGKRKVKTRNQADDSKSSDKDQAFKRQYSIL